MPNETSTTNALAVPKLGDKVKDVVSGLTGCAVIKSFHLNGCVQIMIEGDRTADGKLVYDSFDINRIKVVEPGFYTRQLEDHPEGAAPGGPSRFPVSRSATR